MTTDIQNKTTATELNKLQNFASFHYRLTEMNNQGAALYELCRFIGAKNEAAAVYHINCIAVIAGHLPVQLGHYRDDIQRRINLRVEGDFPELHKAMQSIF